MMTVNLTLPYDLVDDTRLLFCFPDTTPEEHFARALRYMLDVRRQEVEGTDVGPDKIPVEDF